MGCPVIDPTTSDADLARWLAEVTGGDAAEVRSELEAGSGRRTFVVDELLDAGYEGAELLDLVIRLSGLDRTEAVQLITERRLRATPNA